MDNIKHILYIEDNIAYAKSFGKIAASYNVKVHHKTNLEDMIEILPELTGKICAVILDIKCLSKRDQEVDREDFVGNALFHLAQNYKGLPTFILSADPSGIDLVKRAFPDQKLFNKTSEDQIKLLQAIDQIDSELVKIRTQYQEVFNVFNNGLLDHVLEEQIVELLKKCDSTDLVQIKLNLASIRTIQESLFQTINKQRKDILPDSCFRQDGNFSFWEINKHLKGNPTKENSYESTTLVFYSSPIDALSEMMYNVSSDHGSHTPYDNPDYRPTKYTVISCTHALLDLILWFDQIIKGKL